MAKKSVSQSRTMWVKKGETVNGKTVKKGYLAQYGKPAKRVTGKVELTQQTGKAAAGSTVRYKAGRKVTATSKPASTGRTATASSGGSTPRPAGNPNANVKVGTLRVGAAGRATNRWNGKRWVKVASEPQRKPATPSKTGNRTATSATVSAAQKTAKPSGSTSVSRPRGGLSSAGNKWAMVDGKWMWTGGGKPPASSSGPKKGDVKNTMSGTAVYDGSKWVKKK